MLHLVRKLFGGQASPASASPASARAPGAPSEVAGGAVSAFRIAAHLRRQQGYPILDWTAARRFVLAADMADGGAAAASEHLGADLGRLVCALLGQDHRSGWSPAPASATASLAPAGDRRMTKAE